MIVREIQLGKYVVELTISENVILDHMSGVTAYPREELLKEIISDRFDRLTNPIRESDENNGI